jgi:hypothetical protein
MVRTLFLLLLFSTTCIAQDKGTVERDDFNFDGHRDYRVFIMQNGRKAEWEYYLFNPKTRRYSRSEELGSLWNPQFDQPTKTISTFGNGGHAGQIFSSEKYIWQNGRLTIMEQVKQDWDRDKKLYYRVTLRRVNGEMTLGSVKLMNDEEVPR